MSKLEKYCRKLAYEPVAMIEEVLGTIDLGKVFTSYFQSDVHVMQPPDC